MSDTATVLKCRSKTTTREVIFIKTVPSNGKYIKTMY